MRGRILVIDDERDILEPVVFALRREGFEVVVGMDGERALELAREEPYDVVILDVILPRLSGLDVCRILRGESDVPIIMLTARDAEVDRVLGLELGADDYLTKPFSTAELVSRVRALIRRRALDRSATGGQVLELSGLRIDRDRHEVTLEGKRVELTSSEYRILCLLAEDPGRVFSRRQIMEYLWESLYVGDARACDTHISNLRRKLERDPAHPAFVLTVRGTGYRFAQP